MKNIVNQTRIYSLTTLWVIGLVALAGCGSQPIQVPTSFANYNSKDGTFACEYPDGWEAKGGGKNGPVWAKFSSGSALIHIKASLTASLMSDASGGRSAGNVDLPPQLQPVHDIHQAYLEMAEEDHNNYAEIAGGPTVLNCKLGPARLSEFTASTTFGTNIHGYRATIIGFNKGVTLYCTCPETEWKKAKPAFDHLLSSFTRGEKE